MILKLKWKNQFLWEKQDWKFPQMKNLKLIIPGNYVFTAYNRLFTVLGAPGKYF